MILNCVEKSLTELLTDIESCNGEEGLKKLIRIESFWCRMNNSNNKKGKVLKAIEKRIIKISERI
jgi:hypothetical protein